MRHAADVDDDHHRMLASLNIALTNGAITYGRSAHGAN